MATTNDPATVPPDSTRSTTTAKRNKRKNAFNLLCATLLGGICYRFGTLAGCASSWLSSTETTYSSSFAPPRREDAADRDHPEHIEARDSPARPRRIGASDRRAIQRTSLPYDCGVVFFYHIPSSGGSSINNWFKKYTLPPLETLAETSHFERWQQAVRKDGSFHPNPESVERQFRRGMNHHIQNLSQHEWRVAHSHSLSTYLNESEDLLYKWRADVEAQGCQLINTVMFREPLNHAMSLWKIIAHKNATSGEWLDYLASPTGTGKWGTVLDFFLYNIHGLREHRDYPNGPGGRNPFNVTKEVKVKRALELLHRHFDIVTVSDYAAFAERLWNMTGWPHRQMLNRNRYLKELTYTKTHIETLQKLLKKNGDMDFIDQVKIEYAHHLSYLEE